VTPRPRNNEAGPHHRPAPAPARGSIASDEVLLYSEAARRLGWCAKSRRFAIKAGLRVVRFGRHQYVIGADVLAFFQRLAEQQASDEQQPDQAATEGNGR